MGAAGAPRHGHVGGAGGHGGADVAHQRALASQQRAGRVLMHRLREPYPAAQHQSLHPAARRALHLRRVLGLLLRALVRVERDGGRSIQAGGQPDAGGREVPAPAGSPGGGHPARPPSQAPLPGPLIRARGVGGRRRGRVRDARARRCGRAGHAGGPRTHARQAPRFEGEGGGRGGPGGRPAGPKVTHHRWGNARDFEVFT
mmetsp:Transcript_54759/g.173923  ORF Transcript_54759/g.173923 Transcript_54759/m.173923 type:complete len:201 (+) Transcript_54759:600-1202(+)